jgi:hypothetical protein
MTSVSNYRGYSVRVEQSPNGRWTAKIHRLDSKVFSGMGKPRAVVETRPSQYTEKGATSLATRAIDRESLR